MQTILHDFSGTLYGSPLSQISIINQARDRVALEGMCIRLLVPSSSGVISATPVANGTGYTGTPTVTVTGPDLPYGKTATIIANIVGTAITSYTITSAGTGYVNVPTATVTGTGTGATLTLGINLLNTTIQAQELYTFANANTIIDLTSATTGLSGIYGVMSVAISQGNIRPTMRYLPFVDFQAYCRAFEGTVQNYPVVFTQYGQGESGSIYLFPVPSGTYNMEWDTYCQPIDLVTDSTVEAIPYPWTEAVPYYAAMLCYEYSQRNDDSQRMMSLYKQKMVEARAFSQPPQVPDMYEEED